MQISKPWDVNSYFGFPTSTALKCVMFCFRIEWKSFLFDHPCLYFLLWLKQHTQWDIPWVQLIVAEPREVDPWHPNRQRLFRQSPNDQNSFLHRVLHLNYYYFLFVLLCYLPKSFHWVYVFFFFQIITTTKYLMVLQNAGAGEKDPYGERSWRSKSLCIEYRVTDQKIFGNHHWRTSTAFLLYLHGWRL